MVGVAFICCTFVAKIKYHSTKNGTVIKLKTTTNKVYWLTKCYQFVKVQYNYRDSKKQIIITVQIGIQATVTLYKTQTNKILQTEK